MKKIMIVFALILTIFGSALTITSCGRGGGGNPFSGPVCYYGCPNSKRVKRLSLTKKSQ